MLDDVLANQHVKNRFVRMRSMDSFRFVVLMCLVCVSVGTEAGKYNRVLNIGDAAPEWKGLPGTDGQQHALADLQSAKVIVVFFTCNSCPYAGDVEQRVLALTRDYQKQGVAIVGINANKIAEDSIEAMQQRAKQRGFSFQYLKDESQEIAKAFGAGYTPEFFVFDQAKRLVYMGSLDDSPDGSNVNEQYVRRAVNAALTGSQPSVQETVPIGCRIRFERDGRKRD